MTDHTAKRQDSTPLLVRYLCRSLDPEAFEWCSFDPNILPEDSRHSQQKYYNERPSLKLAKPQSRTRRALVTEHADKPGEFRQVASILAGWGINITEIIARRTKLKGRAAVITFMDSEMPEGILKELRDRNLRPEIWNRSALNDLDTARLPLGIHFDNESRLYHSIEVRNIPDQPGQIARLTRALESLGLGCSGLFLYREDEEKEPAGAGKASTVVIIIDKKLTEDDEVSVKRAFADEDIIGGTGVKETNEEQDTDIGFISRIGDTFDTKEEEPLKKALRDESNEDVVTTAHRSGR